MDFHYCNIKQVYFSNINLNLKYYFNSFEIYSNNLDATIFIGINNLKDFNILTNHKGLRYIFWLPNDIMNNNYIKSIKLLEIEMHFGNMIKTEAYLKKNKLRYKMIYNYFNSFETKYKILTTSLIAQLSMKY